MYMYIYINIYIYIMVKWTNHYKNFFLKLRKCSNTGQ